MEGCYIPFDWRQDFDEQYLTQIRFVCLAMTAKYIENHFDEIISHESEVEEGFQNAGEHVVIIDDDYEETIEGLLI